MTVFDPVLLSTVALVLIASLLAGWQWGDYRYRQGMTHARLIARALDHAESKRGEPGADHVHRWPNAAVLTKMGHRKFVCKDCGAEQWRKAV